jgi:hypothetical protein
MWISGKRIDLMIWRFDDLKMKTQTQDVSHFQIGTFSNFQITPVHDIKNDNTCHRYQTSP